MAFPIPSETVDQLISKSLGANEEFVHVHNAEPVLSKVQPTPFPHAMPLNICFVEGFSEVKVRIMDFLERVQKLWHLCIDLQGQVKLWKAVLLSFIFQCLIGGVPSGGSKNYSSGSLQFRDTFVSIVLFQGAYVWIKFRQVAFPSSRRKRKFSQTPDHASPFNDACDVLEGVQEGVYRRAMKDRLGTITHYKYEPRFKPPRERLDSGATLKFNCLSLGQYNTHHEAQIVRQIAAFFYGKEECHTVQLENGLCFSIPSMSEEEKSFSGMDKAKCVARKTKAVYAEFLEEKKARELQLRSTAVETDSHFSHVNDSRTGCSQAAEIQVCGRPGTSNSEFTLFPDVEPSLAPLEFDLSATFGCFEDMYDENGSLWANAPAPQPIALDNGGITEIVTHPCSLQADEAAAQGLEHIERQLVSPQMASLLGEVNHLQQLVTHQKKRLEDSAMWNVELQHQLMESDIRKSELQRENECLRTMLQQVPKSHVAGIEVPKGRNAGYNTLQQWE